MRPRDWDICTVEETDALLDWLDSYKEQLDEAEAEMKRG
jgi:hypothetical protein